MLQELAGETGAAGWAIASMLFFAVVWLIIVWRVVRARPDEMEARARLALEGEAEERDEARTRGHHG
ncbi:MAG: hypothetical protein MUE61_14520 [Vicinamibacterales bacterium]|jgi:hypothetical protein|nr:hypothetical protein [Vicinamibacterales bacterium]